MRALGHVFKYGDNVDTDVIIPARYLNSFDGKELASHAMVDIDPEFAKKVQPGDLIVAKDVVSKDISSSYIRDCFYNNIEFDYKKYSTSEQFIGYYINNKTLWQKSFAVTLPNNNTGSVNVNFTTEKVVNIYGSYTDGTRVYPINYHDQTSHNEINTSYENSYINFETNFDGSNYTGYVTLEYTKD